MARKLDPRLIAGSLTILTALGLCAAPLVTARSAIAAKPIEIMSVDDVKPGMKGHAVTVFSGSKTDRFEIEIIDVIHDYQPGQDAVLFRSSDPRLEHSGIVGGMSGSPIFIDGKLLGALAYGYRFNKDPIGGLTPIEKMLEVDKLPFRPEVLPNAPARGRDGTAAWADEMLGMGTAPTPMRRRPSEIPGPNGAPPPSGLTPLGAPMSVSGFGPMATQFLGDAVGLMPVRGGSGRGKAAKGATSATKPWKKVKGKGKQWKPGDAVSVVLIAGDNSAAPNGTVTWVNKKGNHLLAFGHPMYGAGPTRLPMADARVHVIIPSVERSVKLSSPLGIQGTMIQDRQPAISLRTDIESPMIPVTTTVRGAEDKLGPRRYESAVATHVDLTPSLVGALLLDGVEEAGNDAVEVSLLTRHRISLTTKKGPRTIELEEETYYPQGIVRGTVARSRAIVAIAAALNNDFEVADIRSVEQHAELKYGTAVERIREVRLVSDEVRAGGLVRLEVVLEPPRGDKRTERIALRVPEEAAGKTVHVHIAGGEWVRPYQAIPDDVDELLDNLTAGYRTRAIIASLFTSAEGLSTRRGLMRDLPDSVLETLSPSGSTRKAVRFKQVARRVINQKQIIEGEQRLEIDVLPPRHDD